jgi:hemolysin-activating ACP:hemolysin acyltransferase
MLQPATESNPSAQPEPRPALRVVRPDNAYAALGMAVSHLMTKPAFAQLRFGDWSRILVGQINRKHFMFALDAENKVRGFLGWALAPKDKAEAWVEGRGRLLFEDSLEGDCIVFNAFASDNAKVRRFLINEARKIAKGKDTLYFKRYYKDGTNRPVRLPVNDFLAGHIEP